MSDQDKPEIQFPIRFTIKAVGRDMDDFRALVISIVSQHTPGVEEKDVHIRPSRGGNYISVSVTITAKSKAQLDAIYQDLNDHERVLMTL